MNPKIAFVTNFPDAADVAREMTPRGFDLVVVPGGSAEYREAMAEAEYLVGFVAGLVKKELFEISPKLRLVERGL
jgi:putative intracellular protease/amidase